MQLVLRVIEACGAPEKTFDELRQSVNRSRRVRRKLEHPFGTVKHGWGSVLPDVDAAARNNLTLAAAALAA